MEKLAIDGGKPVRTKGPIIETDVFEKEEFDALMEVAKSKKLRRAEAALEYVSVSPNGSVLNMPLPSPVAPQLCILPWLLLALVLVMRSSSRLTRS